MGFIDESQLLAEAEKLAKNSYGTYLRKLTKTVR